ncbi:TPA: glycoside hydrolase family 108 protein, partial [Acinetobacter baumannii]
YTKISTFNAFGKGWMARVALNLKYAAEDMS